MVIGFPRFAKDPTMAGAAEALIEHLHFGKLVTDEGRVPNAQGYAVTRRSKNLDADDEVLLSLSTLLEVRPFAPDLIDPSASEGILVVRWLAALKDRPARVAIIRARFRPEDGKGAGGRPHEQAAIWIASAEDWIRYPLPLLRRAAELQATPDRVTEPRNMRIGTEPHRIDLSPEGDARNAAPAELSGATLRICDFILRATRCDAGEGSLLFGGNDFETELQFLEAVGLALACLPEERDDRQQIVISSGFKHRLGAVSIRYLKSATSKNGEFDENAARARLEAFCSSVDGSAAQHAGATPAEGPGAPAAAALLVESFQRHCRSYLEKPSAPAANDLINAAVDLGEWRDRDEAIVDAVLLERCDGRERDAFISIDSNRRSFMSIDGNRCSVPGDMPMGNLLDVAELCARAEARGDRSSHYGCILNLTDAWLAKLGVWLPAELDQLKSCTFLNDIMNPKCVGAYERSLSLYDFVSGRGSRDDFGARQRQIEAVEQINERLTLPNRVPSKWPELWARYAKIGSESSMGIHGTHPIWRDAIVVPGVYTKSVEQVLARIIRDHVALLRL
jgi:hypothetical protein